MLSQLYELKKLVPFSHDFIDSQHKIKGMYILIDGLPRSI